MPGDQPTLEQQIAEFQGFTAVDGQIRPETPAKPADAAPASDAQDAPEEQTPAQRLAALDKPTKSSAKPTKSDDASEEPAEDAEEPAEGEEQRQPERRASADKRIAQAVGRQRAAERQLAAANARYAALEARMSQLEAGLTPPQQRNSVQSSAGQLTAPNPNDYPAGDMDGRYLADVARYETRVALAEAAEQDKQSRQTAQQQAQQQALRGKLDDFEASGLALYDDFDEVVVQTAERGEWSLSPMLASLVLDSENGPHIAYHLATNRAEAAKVARMTPAGQAAWFGRRDAVLSSATPGAGRTSVPVVSRAPEPPRHVARGSGTRTHISPSTQDFAEFERLASGKP